jgi:hypothetical protein
MKRMRIFCLFLLHELERSVCKIFPGFVAILGHHIDFRDSSNFLPINKSICKENMFILGCQLFALYASF